MADVTNVIAAFVTTVAACPLVVVGDGCSRCACLMLCGGCVVPWFLRFRG